MSRRAIAAAALTVAAMGSLVSGGAATAAPKVIFQESGYWETMEECNAVRERVGAEQTLVVPTGYGCYHRDWGWYFLQGPQY